MFLFIFLLAVFLWSPGAGTDANAEVWSESVIWIRQISRTASDGIWLFQNIHQKNLLKPQSKFNSLLFDACRALSIRCISQIGNLIRRERKKRNPQVTVFNKVCFERWKKKDLKTVTSLCRVCDCNFHNVASDQASNFTRSRNASDSGSESDVCSWYLWLQD